MLLPPFAAGVMSYRVVSLPPLISHVCLSLTFNLTLSIVQPAESLGSGNCSSWLALAAHPAATVFNLSSPDGTYSVSFTRSTVDLANVAVRGYDPSNGGISQGDATLLPTFDAAVTRNYSMVPLPYRASQYAMIAVYVTSAIQTRALSGPYVAFEGMGSAVETTTRWSINVGASQVQLVRSSTDGDYRFNVTRSYPDMQAIALHAYPMAGSGAVALLNNLIGPTYSIYLGPTPLYRTNISYAYDSVRLTLDFLPIGTVSIVSPEPLVQVQSPGVLSQSFPVGVGNTTLLLVSSRDGNYSLQVSRAQPDILSLALSPYCPWPGMEVPITLSKPFSAGNYSYTATFPYVNTGVRITAVFNSLTVGVMTASINGGVAVSLTSGMLSAPLLLQPGVNVLRVFSLLDGVYVFTFTRADPISSYISGRSVTVQNALPGDLYPLPTFTPTQQYYTINVNYIVAQVSFTHLFPAVNLTSGGWKFKDAGLTPATSDVIPSGTATPWFALAIGSNTVELSNALDGVYLYTIVRAAPTLTALSAESLDTATASWQNANSGYVPLFDTSKGAFIFSLYVASTQSQVRFLPTFTVGTLTLTATPPGAGPAGTITLSNGLRTSGAGTLLAAPLINTFFMQSSADGNYTISVFRTLGKVATVYAKAINPFSLPAARGVIQTVPTFVSGSAGPYELKVPFAAYQLMLVIVHAYTCTYATSPAGGVGGWGGNVAVGGGTGCLVSGSDSGLWGGPGAYILRNTPSGNVITVQPNPTVAADTYTFVVNRTNPDVTSILITVDSRTGANLTSIPGTITPSYAPLSGPEAQTYKLTVSWGFGFVRVAARFSVPTTVTADTPDSLAPVLLYNGVVSEPKLLPLAKLDPLTPLYVRSFQDGDYNINITRSAPDIFEFPTFVPASSIATAAPVIWKHAPLPFDPANYTYTGTVTYVTNFLSLSVKFTTGSSVKLTGVKVGAPITINSMQLYGPFNLTDGANVFVVESSLDGYYAFNIIRLKPALQQLQFRVATTTRQMTVFGELQLTPPFSSGITSYALDVPYSSVSVAISVYFDESAGSMVYDRNQGPSVNGQNSTFSSPEFVLTPGPQMFRINSSTDGMFYFNLTRLAPDVRSIVLTGRSTTAQVYPTSYLAPNATFIPGAFLSYTVSVWYIAHFISASVQYTYGGTVSAGMAHAQTDLGLTLPLTGANTASPLPLQMGPLNVLTIYSLRDGNYTITVIREAPDVQLIEMWGNLLSDETPIALSSTITPAPFQPGQLLYDSLIPARVHRVAFRITFLTPASVTVDRNGVAGSVTDHVWVSAQPTSLADLNFTVVGGSYGAAFFIRSIRDGNYTVNVTRSSADLVSVVLNSWGGVGDIVKFAPLVYSRPFVAKSFEQYVTVTVPFVQDSVTVFADFTLQDSVTYWLEGDSPSAPVTRIVDSPMIPLTPGVDNLLYVNSTLDGQYVFNITRRIPDVTDIVFSAFPWTNSMGLPSSPLTLVPPFDAADGAVLNPSFGVPAPFIHNYTAYVNYILGFVSIQAFFGLPGTVTIDNSSMPVTQAQLARALGVTVLPNTTLPLSGDSSPVFQLQVGPNPIHVVSTADGNYSMWVVRAQPDMLATSLLLRPVSLHGHPPAIVMKPAFQSHLYEYDIVVPFGTIGFHVHAMLTSGSPVPIKVENQVLNTEQSYFLPADASASLMFDLLSIGDYVFHIDHPLDGHYRFLIHRQAPDVQRVTWMGQMLSSIFIDITPLVKPMYVPGVYANYSAIVPYVYANISSNAQTNQNTTTTLWYDEHPVKVLASEEQSPQISWPIGAHTFVINSTRDGEYFFNITRNPPDVTVLKLFGRVLSNGDVIDYSLSPLLKPSHHQPGFYEYSIVFPYVISAVSFTAVYAVPGSVRMDNGVTNTGPLVPSGMMLEPPFNLLLGANTYHVASSQDGNYTFSVTRSPPDVYRMRFTGVLWDQVSTRNIDSMSSPLYTNGTYFYTLTVPFIYTNFTFAVWFSFPGTIQLDYNGVSLQELTNSTSAQVVSGVDTLRMRLLQGTNVNVLHLQSQQDGNYTINIVRLAPDVTAAVLSSHTGLDATPVQYSSVVPLTPLYMGGWFWYSVSVPFVMRVVSLRSTFAVEHSLMVDMNRRSPRNVTSGQSSLQFNVSVTDVYSNVLHFDSTVDGNYSIKINRRVPDVFGLLLVAKPAPNSNASDMHVEHTLSPAWCPTCGPLPGVYTLNLGYIFSQVAFFPNFSVAGSLRADNADTHLSYLWNQGCVGSNMITAGGSQTPFGGMRIGNNTFHLCSSEDGVYTFVVNRAAPDIQYAAGGIKLFPISTLGPSPPVQFDTPLDQDSHLYRVIIPYVTTSLHVQVFFNTSGSVSIQQDGQVPPCVPGTPLCVPCSTNTSIPCTGSGAPSHVAVSGVVYGRFNLSLGENELTISSSRDGLYTFRILRLPPDVQQLQLTATQTTTPVLFNATHLITPPYVPGITLGYTVTVPYVLESVSFSLNYSVPHSIQPDADGLTFPVPYTASTDTVKNAFAHLQTPPFFVTFPLRVGLNTLRLNSTQDGLITIKVTRLAPDVRSMRLYTLNNVSHWETNVTSRVSPLFMPGAFNYTLILPYIMHWVRVVNEYNTALSVTVDNGPTNEGPRVATKVSSEWFFLQQGNNVLHVCSERDGNYTVNITRLAPDLTDLLIMGRKSVLIDEVSLSPLLTPLYKPGGLFYTLNSPYIVPHLSLFATFAVNNSVTFRVNSGSLTPMVTGVRSPYIPLLVEPAMNYFMIYSTVDGNYSIALKRSLPDLTSLHLWGYTLIDVGPDEILFSPPFNGQVMFYTATIPFIYRAITFTANFTFVNSTSVSRNLLTPYTTLPILAHSTKYELSVGNFSANTMLLQSERDGNYSVMIRRLEPDVTFVSILAMPAVGSGIPSFLQPLTPPFNASAGPLVYSTNVSDTFARLRYLVRLCLLCVRELTSLCVRVVLCCVAGDVQVRSADSDCRVRSCLDDEHRLREHGVGPAADERSAQ